MQIYLVGGAVRDKLLNYPSPDHDWVVVGSTPEQMIAAGYQTVGKDFPVFLHPETKEEYALARQERKSGHGYQGFIFHTSPAITLEEDLLRRDLTINAMAMDSNSQIIDPYGGLDDLEKRQLRHVSPSFAEDPVRVLRVARFAARYHHMGFTIADETLALMRSMVDAGEVSHLVAERVWKEFSRALSETSPHIFIETLRACGALRVLMPEVDCLFGVPQPEAHHPEVDTGLHSLLSLQRICELSTSPEARLATLLHDLGKGLTTPEQWPSHHDHETAGLTPVSHLCERLNAPNTFKELALAVCEFHTHSHRALALTPKTLLKMLQRLDAFRRPERFEQFCLCCQADARGRTGFEQHPYPQAAYLLAARSALDAIDTQAIAATGVTGAAFGEALHKQRLTILKKLRENYL